MDVTSSDEDLVSACRDGNQQAWAALIEKYQRLVYAMPAKFQLPPEDAADVFQSVWADLYRDLPRIEQPNALRAWLMTAATRRCLLLKKRRQRLRQHTGFENDLADTAPDVGAVQAELVRDQHLREAIAGLPDRCRRIVEMLFYEQPARPYAEVARELGLAEGSIGFIRGRCLKRLRDTLQDKGL